MKKLLIAMAVVATAVVANAAAVSWDAGTLYTPASADGGWSTTKAKATVTGTLYLLALGDADTEGSYTWFQNKYNADGNMKAVYDYFTTGAGKATASSASGTSASRTSALSLSTDGDVGDTYYAAIIYTTTATFGGTDSDFYIANLGTATVESDMGASAGPFATNYYGTGSAIGGWTAVPEPTSGLLLLLGVAGLALKRKRA